MSNIPIEPILSINIGRARLRSAELSQPAAQKARGTRNTRAVVEHSLPLVTEAVAQGVMHRGFLRREGTKIEIEPGVWVSEFVNCSYLGLDMRPEVVASYKSIPESWGVGFCCARTRLSLAENFDLETALSRLFGARAVVFPSVTSTHMSVMPLLASGAIFGTPDGARVRLIFDKLAHSSMQYLRPVLEKEAEVVIIDHNAIDQLRFQIEDAEERGMTPVYVSDGVYSMGGACPIDEVRALLNETGLWWYVDDAHGTSLYGERGQGYVIDACGGELPRKTILTFSLAKAFGATGGGVLVGGADEERLIRYFGQTYAFSAPMDYGAIAAAMTLIGLHRDGTVKKLQDTLSNRIAAFDRFFGKPKPGLPIRMVFVGDEREAIAVARKLLDQGYMVNCAFFPTVGRGKAQLRISLSAAHTLEQVRGLAKSLKALGARQDADGGLVIGRGRA